MSGEKTEEATDKKKEDSRKKGQVAVSKDIQVLSKVLFFYLLVFALIDDFSMRLETDFSRIIDISFGGNLNVSEVIDISINLFIYIVMPMVGVCLLASTLTTWLQVGLVFAPEAVVPSFKKFNFVQNIKGMFSKKSFVQLLLSFVKLIVLAVVSWLLLVEYSTEIVLSYRGDIDGVLDLLVFLLKVMVYSSLAVFIVLSAIDWMAVFFDHKKQIKMSKNEVKDERKQMYGDPALMNKRKSMHKNLINSSLQSVSESKVVVANPTHVSVALDYEPGKHDIPFIVCMGEDEDAMIIRKKADELGIPIIRSVQLARQLYAECGEEEYIQEQHLELAAEVFRMVFSMSGDGVKKSKTNKSSGETRH